MNQIEKYLKTNFWNQNTTMQYVRYTSDLPILNQQHTKSSTHIW